MAISGRWSDGTALPAVPNFARLNRGSPTTEFPVREGVPDLSRVWINS